MQITKEKVETAIKLEQDLSAYLERIRTPKEAEMGLLFSKETRLDKIRAIEASAPHRAFEEFLFELSDDEFRELQGIMFVGRGDYKPTDFERACTEPGLNKNRKQDVDYVMEKMGAANYFADGFEKLNLAGVI